MGMLACLRSWMSYHSLANQITVQALISLTLCFPNAFESQQQGPAWAAAWAPRSCIPPALIPRALREGLLNQLCPRFPAEAC